MKIKYTVNSVNKNEVLKWLIEENFEFKSHYSSRDSEQNCPTYWSMTNKNNIVLIHDNYVRRFFTKNGIPYNMIKSKQHLFELLNIKL